MTAGTWHADDYDDEPTPSEHDALAADDDGSCVRCAGVLRRGRCTDCEGER